MLRDEQRTMHLTGHDIFHVALSHGHATKSSRRAMVEKRT